MVHRDEGFVVFFPSTVVVNTGKGKKTPTFLKLKVLVDRTHPKIEFYSSSYAQRTHSLPSLLVFSLIPLPATDELSRHCMWIHEEK